MSNANVRVLHVLAGERDATMSAETAHVLVNKPRFPGGPTRKPLKLATVKRALRRLRAHGLAEATDHYDRKKNRRVNLWFATAFGVREDTHHW